MRTKSCRLIGLATCTDVSPIRLDFIRSAIETDGYVMVGDSLDPFAQSDGFATWAEMVGFWRKMHPEVVAAGAWEGVRIQWGRTFLENVAA